MYRSSPPKLAKYFLRCRQHPLRERLPRELHSHDVSVTTLHAVVFPIAHVVVHVGQCCNTLLADTPPHGIVVALGTAVQRQCRCQYQAQGLTSFDREQLVVDVERHGDLAIGRGAEDAGYAIVFLIVDGGDGERLFEDLGVGHGGSALGFGA